MGTSFELVLVGEGSERRRLLGAGEAALEVIREVEQRWSLFLPQSMLARLNREGHRVALDLDFSFGTEKLRIEVGALASFA